MLKIGDFSRLSQLFGELFRDFPGSAARGPCFAIWHDDEHKDQDVDAEACVPIDEKYQSPPSVRCADLPTVKVASLIHHGAYNRLSQSYQIVLKWIEANGYQVHGPIREIYLHYEDPVRQDELTRAVPAIELPITCGFGPYYEDVPGRSGLDD